MTKEFLKKMQKGLKDDELQITITQSAHNPIPKQQKEGYVLNRVGAKCGEQESFDVENRRHPCPPGWELMVHDPYNNRSFVKGEDIHHE